MPTSELLRVVAAPMRRQARPLSLSAALSVVRIGAVLIRPWPLAIAVDYAIDGTRSLSTHWPGFPHNCCSLSAESPSC